ncbi:MAG: methyltransferase domain-containing protein [candidate division Zixibacteria bacterium]|nr:methyltransferase domain-containing protein [candidate division Zixibacteria bacterium]
MDKYYSRKLSAERLKLCYDIAPPRVQQYLQAEIDYVASKINRGEAILELGCGYGRVIRELDCSKVFAVGIDTSVNSLKMAKKYLSGIQSVDLVAADAISTGFHDQKFDLVFCIQNGISAFKVDRRKLIKEALRMTKPGGKALFTSYSSSFWDERLKWFEIQAAHGLVGEIDYELTGNGIIYCKDGFKATTIGIEDFQYLTSDIDALVGIKEVDNSSVFCELTRF